MAATAQVSAAKAQAGADMFIGAVQAHAAITQTKEVGKRTLETALINRQMNLDSLSAVVKQAKNQEEATDERFRIQAVAIERQEQRKIEQQRTALAFQQKQADQQLAVFREQAAQTLALAQSTYQAQLVQQSLAIGDAPGGQGRLDLTSAGVASVNGGAGLGVASFRGVGTTADTGEKRALDSAQGIEGAGATSPLGIGLSGRASQRGFQNAEEEEIAASTSTAIEDPFFFEPRLKKRRLSRPRRASRALLASLDEPVLSKGKKLRGTKEKRSRGGSSARVFARGARSPKLSRGFAPVSFGESDPRVPPLLARKLKTHQRGMVSTRQNKNRRSRFGSDLSLFAQSVTQDGRGPAFSNFFSEEYEDRSVSSENRKRRRNPIAGAYRAPDSALGGHSARKTKTGRR